MVGLLFLVVLAVILASSGGDDGTETEVAVSPAEVTQVVVVTATYTPSPTVGHLTMTAIYEVTFEAAVAATQESAGVAVGPRTNPLPSPPNPLPLPPKPNPQPPYSLPSPQAAPLFRQPAHPPIPLYRLPVL